MSENKSFDASVLLKQRENAVIIFVAAIFLFITKSVYQKQMMEYNKLTTAIKTEEEKGVALENIIALDNKIKLYRVRSWSSMETSVIVDQINVLGSEVPIRLKNINPGNKVDQANYAACPFEITCEGTYKDLVKFIQKLETYHKGIIRVVDLKISTVKRKEKNMEIEPTPLNIKLSVEAYYLKK